MYPIRVHVPQRLIDVGLQCACYSCPIAKSLNEIFGKPWEARVTSYISLSKGEHYLSAPTPKIALDFMVLFDSDHPSTARPFSFDIAFDGPTPATPLQPVTIANGLRRCDKFTFTEWWLLGLPTPDERSNDELLAIAKQLGLAWWPGQEGDTYRTLPSFRQHRHRLLIQQVVGFNV